MSIISYNGKIVTRNNTIAVVPTVDVIYFETLDHLIEFNSLPDVTGNKTLKFNLFIDSSESSFDLSLVDPNIDDFIRVGYYEPPELEQFMLGIGPGKRLLVQTKGDPKIRNLYDIPEYVGGSIKIEIIKTDSLLQSVKINETEANILTFSLGITDVDQLQISGGGFSIWNLEIVGNHKWMGFPEGNTESAWADTIGNIDVTISGSPKKRKLVFRDN